MPRVARGWLRPCGRPSPRHVVPEGRNPNSRSAVLTLPTLLSYRTPTCRESEAPRCGRARANTSRRQSGLLPTARPPRTGGFTLPAIERPCPLLSGSYDLFCTGTQSQAGLQLPGAGSHELLERRAAQHSGALAGLRGGRAAPPNPNQVCGSPRCPCQAPPKTVAGHARYVPSASAKWLWQRSHAERALGCCLRFRGLAVFFVLQTSGS